MSLQRTVKWMQKTCKVHLKQKEEINFVRQFNIFAVYLPLITFVRVFIKTLMEIHNFILFNIQVYIVNMLIQQDAVKDARKLFRLFKSINQYQKMMGLLLDDALNFQDNDQDYHIEAISILLKVLSKICFFFYWFFDNISILSKIKLFNKSQQRYNAIGSIFWFLGLIISVFTQVYELKNFDKWFSKYYKTKLGKAKQKEQLSSIQQISLLTQQQERRFIKLDMILNCTKNIFDLLPAGKDSYIFEKIVGFGGLVSALISTYQVYKS